MSQRFYSSNRKPTSTHIRAEGRRPDDCLKNCSLSWWRHPCCQLTKERLQVKPEQASPLFTITLSIKLQETQQAIAFPHTLPLGMSIISRWRQRQSGCHMVDRGSHVGEDCDKKGLLGGKRMVAKKGKTRVSAHRCVCFLVLTGETGKGSAPQRLTKHMYFLAQIPST